MLPATLRCGNSRPSWKTRPDPPPLRGRAGHVVAVDDDGARTQPAHAGERLQHEALAGAARAEQHGVLAVGDLEVERPHREVAGRDLDPAQADHAAPLPERRAPRQQDGAHHEEDDERHDHDEHGGRLRRLQPEALEALEGEHRDDLGVVGEDDDGAELADAAAPHQDGAGEHPAPRLRERDAAKAPHRRGAQRARHVLVALVHERERLARAVDEERQAHEQHGEDDAGDRLGEPDAERREQPADDALAGRRR